MEADAGASPTITMPNGQSFTVPVPAGVHDGEVIRLQGPDESPNSGKVVFLTIGIKQAEETSPTLDVLSAAPTLYTSTSTEEASSSSDVLSAAPMPIAPEPRLTPRLSFDPVSDDDLPTIAVSDSKAAPVEEQPAPSFLKRVLTRSKRLFRSG